MTATAFGRTGVDGEPLYRTGDLACWTEDELLDCLGRTDDQVKIRGYRVELAEVEHQLRAVAAVRDAVVLLRRRAGGVAVLAGYVTADSTVDGAQLRAALLTELPEHMVPTAYLRVDSMPLTANGKVDRAGLAQLEPVDCTAADSGHRAPRTALERTVADVFARVLGVPTVSVDDNFFDLGGHSLLAMRLWSELRSTVGVDIALMHVMDNPTVAGLVARLGTAAGHDPRAPETDSA